MTKHSNPYLQQKIFEDDKNLVKPKLNQITKDLTNAQKAQNQCAKSYVLRQCELEMDLERSKFHEFLEQSDYG